MHKPGHAEVQSLLPGAHLLTPCPPVVAGLDIRRLRAEARNLLEALQSGADLVLKVPRIHLHPDVPRKEGVKDF